jgi:hypothetical protein
LSCAFSFHSLVELFGSVVYCFENEVVEVRLVGVEILLVLEPLGEVGYCFLSCLGEV